ncbi:MAG TPA: hypothetical protein VFC86_06140 [Planctomycetota bacterium]|nr:hypothetical protein [Planctomycetota bacterium]
MAALRSAAIALAFLAAAGDVLAQDQDQMKRNLDKKLEAEFLKKAKWILEFDEAKAAAKKDHKLIFAYFTRSYST